MRKMTIAMMVLIFLAMVMVMTGCATTKPVSTPLWSNSYITGKIEVHEEDINSIKAQLNKLEETDKKMLDGIEEIKANFYPETEIATVVAAVVKEDEELEVTEASSEPPEEVILLAPLAPILEPKKADLPKKVKFVKTTSDIEQMEIWVNGISDRITKLEERVDTHGRKINKFSGLRRRLAEVEDEIRPVRLWTKSFPSRLPKKPEEEKEKPQLPTGVKPGLDRMAIEILAGRLQVETEVFGHADPLGKKKDNEELSKRRAQSCINYLVEKLGPDSVVPWDVNTKWKDYFMAVAGGETSRYGNLKFNRRVYFKKVF
ncbi:MAG: OmpA family protein [Candidatus Aminicenantes bacterium]|nr:OmpA family protein [Candidatus Aminicenantes bacterium]